MLAVRIARLGGPEALELLDLPLPNPGPGEVRVRVGYAGLNYVDIYHRTGLYPPGSLPAPIGREGSGRVEACGPGVHSWKEGDRVAFLDVPGAYAEAVVVRADRLLAVPPELDLAMAAALPLQALTAGMLVRTIGQVQAGTVLLVHSAASGVGRMVVELARAYNARILGTCSSEAKAERARVAGCDRPIVTSEESFAEVVLRDTGGRGADVVYDAVGQATFRDSVRATRIRGTLVLYGQSSGPVEPFSPRAVLGSRTLVTASIFDYVTDSRELQARWEQALDDLQSRRLSAEVDSVFPLDQAVLAHERLQSRERTGKVLLAVHPELESRPREPRYIAGTSPEAPSGTPQKTP